ncbi:hypothetical protein MM326_15110 [Alkalihalobacillus sp. LMS6]|uniref:hypothetical protein n=1 Tax=Alkalihalobacillus sp. LMS6 TaxID=2924034 RepID=UPI0020D1CCD1|nr:hypothetical protein [Alkalihalobacillus sp. LMS6]UTR05425.1 hypothetical protein MM326_15110 [Alkalihalobacillus sp. LMS6]
MSNNSIDAFDDFNNLNSTEKQTLLNWCNKLEKIKSINEKHTSYSLKHFFEKSEDGFYISNGQFKGAMLECGFTHQEIPDSPNWQFNVSEKSIASLINA